MAKMKGASAAPATPPLKWLARLWERLDSESSAHDTGRRFTRPFWIFMIVFLAGMVLISLFGDQGLIAYYRLEQKTNQLRGEVKSLDQKRRELGTQIEALKGDPAYIEFLARKRLGLVKPGDTVVQLPRNRELP